MFCTITMLQSTDLTIPNFYFDPANHALQVLIVEVYGATKRLSRIKKQNLLISNLLFESVQVQATDQIRWTSEV